MDNLKELTQQFDYSNLFWGKAWSSESEATTSSSYITSKLVKINSFG